jgi:hypothetical protein
MSLTVISSSPSAYSVTYPDRLDKFLCNLLNSTYHEVLLEDFRDVNFVVGSSKSVVLSISENVEAHEADLGGTVLAYELRPC